MGVRWNDGEGRGMDPNGEVGEGFVGEGFEPEGAAVEGECACGRFIDRGETGEEPPGSDW